MARYIGTVVEGKKEARGLGYPTANLAYESGDVSENGVWSCRASIDGTTHNALAVIGMWQLENGLPSLEVHLLNFTDDIYGRELMVELIERLRGLLPFTDVDALKKQIADDLILANKRGF
ncbi:MAG: riboflavin kinase [Patescibacteria group bacterium]